MRRSEEDSLRPRDLLVLPVALAASAVLFAVDSAAKAIGERRNNRGSNTSSRPEATTPGRTSWPKFLQRGR